MNKLIRSGRHTCPSCDSDRGLAYYEDAAHCFSCGTHFSYDRGEIVLPPPSTTTYSDKQVKDLFDITKLQTLPIADRNISKDTVEKYGVGIEMSETGQPAAHYYPIYETGNNPKQLGHFIRQLPKNFRHEPAGMGIHEKAGLFGQNLFPPGSSKALTVTEGHTDAMAAFEMMGSKYASVSVVNGADNATKDFKRNLEYLESFEKVYICFDRDPPGQKAAIACARLLAPGKAYVVALDPKLKDPVGYKQQNKQSEFTKAWWSASMYTPAGIIASSTLKERIRNRDLTPGIPYPFKGMNDLTYGIRKKEAVVVTAPTGVGKTSFIRECMYNILQHDKKAKIGTMFLEEGVDESGLGLMSTHASIPFHLPDTEYTQEQYDEAERILDDDRVFFFDHFGSNSIDDILSRIRYYARALGCEYIFLDHLSIIVSDQQQGDERKKLDEIMTKLKTMTMELEIALMAVVHTNRAGQIRGTAGIEQMANIVIKLERDVENADPSTRKTLIASVPKNRFSGRTGPAFQAKYNDLTGRLEETDEGEWVTTDEELTHFLDGDKMVSEEVA